jgi:hypothetical protein
MFRTYNIARVASAAVGALVLSTLSVTAAVGPGHQVQPAPTAYASADVGTRAHG